jgi:hypothetical protein
MARGHVTQAVKRGGYRGSGSATPRPHVPRRLGSGWAVFSYVAAGLAAVAAGGLTAVFSSWQLCACAATGILSTWPLQTAYLLGPLTAAQPGTTHRTAD